MVVATAWEFFQQNNVNLGAETTNHPDLMIAEVGWPSVGISDLKASLAIVV